jgi:pimeloyl-ACP methyl ester carboxylesterase
VIRELGLEKPLLVGHSMGGAVALATALDHPGLLGGLALVAPLSQVPQLPAIARSRLVRVRALQLVWARIVAVPAITALGARRRNRIFWPETMPADFETKGGGYVMRRPDLLANGLDDLSGLLEELPAMVARYGTLRLPVEILFGRDDQVLDARTHGEATAKAIREARCTVRDGGHMLPVTQPMMVAQWLEEAAARIG